MAVTVAKKGDEGKISSALARLMEEDTTLSYENNAETHQQVIGGLGEQHLDVVKAKLKNKFGVEIGLEAPASPTASPSARPARSRAVISRPAVTASSVMLSSTSSPATASRSCLRRRCSAVA